MHINTETNFLAKANLKIIKITGANSEKTPPTDGGVQLFRSWSHLEMASVLSGWYAGYHHHHNAAQAAAGYHNLFNIANFIEYEPYPKRRKLENAAAHQKAAAAYGRYMHQHQAANGGDDFELTHKEVSRVNSSLYRPYTHQESTSNVKKSTKYLQENGSLGGKGSNHHHSQQLHDRLMFNGDHELHNHQGDGDHESQQDADAGKMTMDKIFPEILSMIFNKLDIQSLGRAAQVGTFYDL